MQPNSHSQIMTAREVSQQYFNGKMSYWTVLEHAKSGLIPSRRIGGKYFFHRDVLDKEFSIPKAS